MVIESINPIIRGWGNYFKGVTVKKSFGELDGYIRGRLRSFEAKRRNLKILVFGIHPSVQFDERAVPERALLYSAIELSCSRKAI